MKRISKSLAVFLTATIVLGMLSLPTCSVFAAQRSYDMEEWDVDGAGNEINPKGFTIASDDPTKVEISCDTSDVYGNTSKKLKINHKESTTTKVTVRVLDADVMGVPISVYWSFVLGEDFEGTGVKLSAKRSSLSWETDYFTDKSYNFWRKMMVFNDECAYWADYTVEFTGTGTVYLDDVSWELSRLINGCFDGVCGDGHLAAYKTSATITGGYANRAMWSFTAGTLTPIKRVGTENASETLVAGAYFVETPEGNYLEFVNLPRGNKMKYASSGAWSLTAGKNYVLRASHMSNNAKNGLGFEIESGFSMPRQMWTNATNTMTEKAFYTMFNSFGVSARPIFYLMPHNAKMSSQSTEIPYVRMDNIRVEEVQENCTLLDADGNPVEALKNREKVNISYQKPLYDGSKDVSDSPKSKDKVAVFAALYDVSGEIPKLREIDVCGALAAEGTFSGDVPLTNSASVGYLPAMYTLEEGFEIPDEGEYMIKVFTMDSVSGLTPKGENVYTFMMEAK